MRVYAALGVRAQVFRLNFSGLGNKAQVCRSGRSLGIIASIGLENLGVHK